MRPFSEKWKYICDQAFGITPTSAQLEVEEWWFGSESRNCLLLGGERSGKSVTSARLLAPCLAPSAEKSTTVWVVGPDYLQARPEFNYLFEMFSELGLIDGEPSMPVSIASPHSFTTTLGHNIMTKSSSDIQKLASFRVDAVIEAEAAQQLDEVRLKLMGRLSETDGPLIISGTLEKGLPWYGDLYSRWQADNVLDARSWSLPTWSNTFVYPGGRDDPKIKELESQCSPEYFMERYGAVPRKMSGLVLPEYNVKTHVRRLELEPDIPVELAIDPGTLCYAVLFVQHVGLKTHVLDRVYKRGTIVQEVMPEVMGNPLWKLIDPDAAGVIDQAGAQRPGSHSQVELWNQVAGISLRHRYIFEEDTIRTLRYHLGDNNPEHEPLILFNDHFTNDRSSNGDAMDILAEPELWQWREGGYRKNEPKRPIDKNNHAMKALGYKIVDRYGIHMDKRKRHKAIRRPYWGVED